MPGTVSGDAYADMCMFLQDSILKVEPAGEYIFNATLSDWKMPLSGTDDVVGTSKCTWVDDDNIYCDKQWGTSTAPVANNVGTNNPEESAMLNQVALLY